MVVFPDNPNLNYRNVLFQPNVTGIGYIGCQGYSDYPLCCPISIGFLGILSGTDYEYLLSASNTWLAHLFVGLMVVVKC